MLASALARIGVDGLMISPSGKGHARSQRHAVEALAARGEHELVVFVREPGAGSPRRRRRRGRARTERLTIDWELRGMPRAARRHRLDAFLSLSERLPLAGGPPVVVWLFESPVHRIRAEPREPARECGSERATRSRQLSGAVRCGVPRTSRSARTRLSEEVLAGVPELRGRTSVVYPGVPPGFSPGQGPSDDARTSSTSAPTTRATTPRVAVEAPVVPALHLVVVGRCDAGVGRRVRRPGLRRGTRRSVPWRGCVPRPDAATRASDTACSRRWRAAHRSSRAT